MKKQRQIVETKLTDQRCSLRRVTTNKDPMSKISGAELLKANTLLLLGSYR